MRLNAFGDPVLQPGDDIAATFADVHGTPDDNYTAWFLEGADIFGWGCELRDSEENTIQADGFDSEQELRDWLTAQGVEIVT